MSITTKLETINDTKIGIKNALNTYFNSQIQSNDTFRSYVNKINDIYTNWPKVTANNITNTMLNNTKKGKINLTLKGNTNQNSYTGKNLLNLTSLQTSTQNGITLTPVFQNNELQYIKINGTATSDTAFIIANYTTTNNNILNGISGGSSTTYKLDFMKIGSLYPVYNGESISLPNDTTGTVRIVVYNGTTINNIKVYPMIRLSSATETYEPYVGTIPSPNPNYPQTISTVSGDNEIKIIGKNLFNDYRITTTIADGITVSNDENGVKVDGTYTHNYSRDYWLTESNNNTYNNLILLKANTTYTASIKLLSGTVSKDDLVMRLSSRTVEDTTFSWNYQTFIYSNNIWYVTFTTSNKDIYAAGIRFGAATTDNITFDNAIFQIQIEENSTATTYEPYVTQIYPIHLPVENLLDVKNAERTLLGGITEVTKGNNYITAITNSATWAGLYVTFQLKAGTYYYQHYTELADTQDAKAIGTFRINKNNSSGAVIYNQNTTIDVSNQINAVTITIPEDGTYAFTYRFGNAIAKARTISIKNIMLSKINASYVPFGTTPIELNEINTSQDEIYQLLEDSKNLFNKDTVLRNKTFTSQDEVSDSTGLYISDYIKVEPNTNYYVNEYCPVVIGLDSNKNSLGYIRNTTLAGSFTTDSTCEYIRVRQNNTSIAMETAIENAMVNKGDAALSYEPYGVKGTWYWKKNIDKTILNGTQNIWLARNTSPYIFALVNNNYKRTEENICYCDYFTSTVNGAYGSMTDGQIKFRYYNDDTNNLYLCTANYSNVNDFTTWLSSHNIEVKYILKAPIYIKITGTLETQLNNLQKAYSYNPQTNIKQESNNLPFILNVSALKKNSN